MNITREQAHRIVEAAIEELQKVEDDHPRIEEVLGRVKSMLEHSIRLDGAIHREADAVRYFGTILLNTAEILGAAHTDRLTPDHVEVITATQRDLTQFACQVLGRPFDAPPTRVLDRSSFTPEELAS